MIDPELAGVKLEKTAVEKPKRRRTLRKTATEKKEEE